MANARFIDANYVFNHTPIDKNVAVELVEKYIDVSQDINIQQTIGYELFNKLVTDIATTGTTTGQYYILLTQFIQRATAEWTLYHILPFINYRITNKAVSEKTSDNSNPTDLNNVIYLRDQVKITAEFYSQRVKEYVLNNLSSFPEYNRITGVARVQSQVSPYYSGIAIPRKTVFTPQDDRDRLKNYPF